jgi:hypothetical protein
MSQYMLFFCFFQTVKNIETIISFQILKKQEVAQFSQWLVSDSWFKAVGHINKC